MKSLLAILIFLSATAVQAQSPGTGCACCSDEYRQFDFWIGDWVVYSQAEMVGFNKITKIEGECILRENWKSVVSSHTGSSYTFYDRRDRKWKHYWMGNDGAAVLLKGELREGKMVMAGEEYRDEKNNRIINKMTWTPNSDGTVRQLWEQSKDGGQAFTVVFDGLYRKRK